MSAIDVSTRNPVRLVPVAIAKPWGREIWYSAIEERGESRVVTAGGELPLSAYLDAVGLGSPVILLKVLDPYPQPVRGDLYFEVHEQKREVYVVTAVDSDAWPDGQGWIRLGMNQQARRRFANDEAFRAAYLGAVRDYRSLRRRIDSGEQVPAEQEARARAAMDAFTSLRRLGVGDVVTIPTWTPHALQHGVRVAEFQTAAYERYIISFAQKVLTQAGWDSDRAIAQLSLDPPRPPVFRTLAPGVERIASFEDFGVWRMAVEPGRAAALPRQVPYALCLALNGNMAVGPLGLGPEEACLVPGPALERCRISAESAVRCLVAAPGL